MCQDGHCTAHFSMPAAMRGSWRRGEVPGLCRGRLPRCAGHRALSCGERGAPCRIANLPCKQQWLPCRVAAACFHISALASCGMRMKRSGKTKNCSFSLDLSCWFGLRPLFCHECHHCPKQDLVYLPGGVGKKMGALRVQPPLSNWHGLRDLACPL